MSRINAAVRRATQQPADGDALPLATVAGEIATMLPGWDFRAMGDGDGAVSEPQPAFAEPPPTTAREGLETPDRVNVPAAARDFDAKLVLAPTMKAYCVEQYRKMAATLHQAQAERHIKVVLIASALPGEGKTLTAVNLALTFSESYRRRVLLIDADLRRPTIHNVFGVPNARGLTDALTSDTGEQVTVVRISPDLSVVPAGAPQDDPMRILTSPRMRQVIQDAAARFDWVLFDTPPVALLPDANLLAAMAEGVLLVVRAGRTPHRPIQRAIESVGRERMLGVVLNGVADDIVSEAQLGSYYGGISS